MNLFRKQSQTEAYAAELSGLLIGQTVVVARGEGQWSFAVGSQFVMTTYGWRLIGSKSIIVTSDDDGHQYGLPSPVDSEKSANDALTGAKIVAVEVDTRTGDCTLRIGDVLTLQFLTMSMGYETWQLYRDGEFFGAVGNEGLR
ncbi:hypothetical protein [Porphyrobacter sp. ULC335]|uniref:hypothetical protein n=1 Tax=Porphyrobacter sp. ULC335 TaxID=2854260 RepID=UPI00221E4DF9|nr:hypothetical protein [Porphyrobacter sp. ULC335]UYV16850.1 hypothetical protein KVF90_05990 [Porphyrobacter sp. ULC335]